MSEESEQLAERVKQIGRVASELKKLGATAERISPTAKFKAYVQKEGRVSIPKAEMDAANLEPGDLVSVNIRKIQKGRVCASCGKDIPGQGICDRESGEYFCSMKCVNQYFGKD